MHPLNFNATMATAFLKIGGAMASRSAPTTVMKKTAVSLTSTYS
jgi:hypothetical protein